MKKKLTEAIGVIGVIAGIFGFAEGVLGSIFSTSGGAIIYSLFVALLGGIIATISLLSLKRHSRKLATIAAVLIIFIPNLTTIGTAIVVLLTLTYLFANRSSRLTT